MEKSALIFDLDNTLYSWMDAYVPALISTINYLAERTNLSQKAIQESFKRVFKQHKSVEVINAVKELDIWDTYLLGCNEKEDIQNSAQSLFIIEFEKGLKLYPYVLDVLKWAKNKGHLLIAFSDARAYWINFRLNVLNIDCFFDRIYTLEDEALNGSINTYPKAFFQFVQEQCKPSTSVLNSIIQDYNLCKKNVYVIGDNKKKDISPAITIGVNNIWARYGKCSLSENKQFMRSITPWTNSQRDSGEDIEPQYTIDNFYDIISIIRQK